MPPWLVALLTKMDKSICERERKERNEENQPPPTEGQLPHIDIEVDQVFCAYTGAGNA